MKIALYNLTTTVKYGGVETFVLGMAGALSARGHQVHLYGGSGTIHPDAGTDVEVRMFPFVDRAKVPNFGSRFRKLVERLSFGYYAYPWLAREGYDVIYLHKPYDLPVALLAGRRSKARIVFSSHGTEFFPGYRFLAKKADLILSCSSYNAGQVESYGLPRPQVLYNGIDTGLFTPKVPNPHLRTQLYIGDEKVLLSACRLVGWKGIQYALKALSFLGERHRVKYVVIGQGEYEKELRRLAIEYNIADKVLFIGQVPNKELPGYYALADVALFPSVADETFGISIAEAMACAVPVVSTTVGGIGEVVGDECGLLVPPKDAHSLAVAVNNLLDNNTKRSEMGKAARNRIVECFSWDRIAGDFERYLENA